jgi:cytidylate kinase
MIVVAIDGPSGVGKSTTSRLVARELGIPHIDTGAMYRAIALRAIRHGSAFDDEEKLAALAADARIEFTRDGDTLRVSLDGEDVTDAIRAPEMSMSASTVSKVPSVRRVLVRLQQQMGRERGGVLEGRDIGTKVFPETPHKFFLTARPETRAARRHRELAARGETTTLQEVLDDQLRRDEQDSTRADSPLTYDSTYEVVDTSDMTIEEVVDSIVGHVRARSDVS